MQVEVGRIFEGKVTGVTRFGAFVDLPTGDRGMVHISEVSTEFVKEISDFVREGQQVKVKVLAIGDNGKISLSMRKALEKKENQIRSRGPIKSRPARPGNFEWGTSDRSGVSASFEDMMSKFKKTSEEKISALKRTTEAKRGGFSRRGSGKSR